MEVWSIAFGGLLGWLTTHIYYKLTSRETTRELAKLRTHLRDRNTPDDFHLALRHGHWQQNYIRNVSTWTCDGNAAFQIEIGNNDRPFDEAWARGFPDANSTCYSVYLRIGGTTFKEILFVSLDGARINVPLPKHVVVDERVTYVWDPSDISFAVGRVLGTYYIYEDIEQVARRCRIEILRETALER